MPAIVSPFKLPSMSRLWIIVFVLTACSSDQEDHAQLLMPEPGSTTEIKIDSITGLVLDEHFELVRAQCTACHSAKLITQNRSTREGWQQMIRWMQAEQGLWDLGTHESSILDYLSRHYAPQQQGRRAPLTDIEWYQLEQ